MPHNRGMDWIKLYKRMAIYIRDVHDCIWCRQVFPLREDGYGLTLDHVASPKDNRASNLVTACHACNSLRGSLSLVVWVEFLAVDGHDPQEVVARVVQHCATPLDLKAGYALAKARRPNYPVKGLFT